MLSGDSRAVLCRGGYACALTDDHKAAREDETVSSSGLQACPTPPPHLLRWGLGHSALVVMKALSMWWQIVFQDLLSAGLEAMAEARLSVA